MDRATHARRFVWTVGGSRLPMLDATARPPYLCRCDVKLASSRGSEISLCRREKVFRQGRDLRAVQARRTRALSRAPGAVGCRSCDDARGRTKRGADLSRAAALVSRSLRGGGYARADPLALGKT